MIEQRRAAHALARVEGLRRRGDGFKRRYRSYVERRDRRFLLATTGTPATGGRTGGLRLGRVRLPAPPAEAAGPGDRLKLGSRLWLTRDGMIEVLEGRVPSGEHVIAEEDLWREEPRIGLQREGGSHTAKEGVLYSKRHVGLKRGVSLGMRVGGLPAGCSLPCGGLLRLGAESRLAACRGWQGAAFEMPASPDPVQGKFALVALTPLDLQADAYRVGVHCRNSVAPALSRLASAGRCGSAVGIPGRARSAADATGACAGKRPVLRRGLAGGRGARRQGERRDGAHRRARDGGLRSGGGRQMALS